MTETTPAPRVGFLNSHVWLVVVLAGTALMCVRTLFHAQPKLMSADSVDYINWQANVPLGYPFFLSSIGVFDPAFEYLPHVQMGLTVVSAAFLAQSSSRLGGPWWIWVLMGVCILGHWHTWRFSWFILSESLFVILLMVFLGCVARALERDSGALVWLFLASAVLGALILVRPVGYALLGVAVLTGLMFRGRRVAAIISITLPAIALLLAVSTWNLLNRGYFATQISGGHNLLGQISLLITPDVRVEDPAAQQVIDRLSKELSLVREQLPRKLSLWQDYYWLTSLAYNQAFYLYTIVAVSDADPSVKPAADRILGLSDPDQGLPVTATDRINAMAWSIGLATIKNRPVDYAYHVFSNLAALWTLPAVTSTEHAESIRRKLDNPSFGGFFRGAERELRIAARIPDYTVHLKTKLLFGLWAISLLVIFVALAQLSSSRLIIFSAVAALCVNAHHLLVALMEAGIFRYAFAMWPAVLAMVAGLLAWLSVQIIEIRRSWQY